MKLKHVFFSSLLLSVGFTACTNEDFTETNIPVNAENAISLGEGFVITGAKYAENPATKSLFEVVDGALMPYWEETDVIGAAWYNYIKEGSINADGLVDENGCAKANTSFAFASNTDFHYLEQVGDKYTARFRANTNVMAGAYVVYYPFDENVTTVSNEITVKREFPIDINLAAGHEFDAINEAMFSYGEAAFIPGGRQTSYFKTRQVPVVYRLKFGASNLNIVGLGDALTIDKIIMEAKNASGSVLATAGAIKPANGGVLTAADYNSYIAYVNGDEDGKELPKAAYTSKSDATVGHYTINVLGGDQAAYQIHKLDEATEGSFIFSALPFTDDATEITFKVILDNGVILSKTITDAATLKIFNDANAFDAEDAEKLVQEDIFVNTQTNDNTIYTIEQFNAQWEAALKATTATTLTIADPIVLENTTLEIPAMSQANITIESLDNATLSVKAIDLKGGKLSFNNGDVEVAEDINTNGDAELNITDGELTAKNLNIGGKATLVMAEMESLYVQASAVIDLTLPVDAEKSGKITVNEGGVLNLKGGVLSSIVNLGGTLRVDAEVANTGSFEGAITGTGKFVNEKGATATFTSTTNAVIENKAGATVNVDKNATLTLSNGSSNAGTINVKEGKLKFPASSDFTQEDNARIYVEEKGSVTGTIAINKGWVVLNHKDAKADNVTGNKAFSVKKVEDFDVAPANTNIFIDADLKLLADKQYTYNTYINANQTFSNGAKLCGNNHLTINGNIEFSGDGSLEVTGAAYLYINGSLTIGKDITLTLANMSKTDYLKIKAADPTKVNVTNLN